MARMTVKQAVKKTGRSESWLRRYQCAWCEQGLLDSLRYGCGAIYGKCDPAAKDYMNMKRASGSVAVPTAEAEG